MPRAASPVALAARDGCMLPEQGGGAMALGRAFEARPLSDQTLTLSLTLTLRPSLSQGLTLPVSLSLTPGLTLTLALSLSLTPGLTLL